ncbi:ankyrin [Neocallimastix californiae]|uniref:Ankyrin n=1 Tax=Neocallimastix californiae TaxID=1754190 RepID=A0A1Y2DZR8_9FUNG|nr:ankyrin [Neocallimastix californiae]|eukprot:ORY64594.1 ankyrin [Neocallimastix californiae]
MTISTIDELKNDIINRLKNRNINDLKSFIMYHNVNLKEIEKYGYDDLLYLAIKEDNPKEVINYIVKECQYDTVNYVIDSNSSTPIGLAVARSNFEVANLLYNEYNADINFGESLNKCLPFAYKNGNFSLEQLTYLLDRGYDKNGILEETIKLMVTSFHNNHIKLIWDHYIYDSSFIIKVLEKRKGRRVYSSSEWEKILSEEKQKLHITDSLYETAFENKNWEALQIFLNYDGRDQKVPIFDMIEENEIIERAIDSEDLPTIQAISNYGYALNYKTFNFEELIMKAYSKVNKDIWKLLIKSSLLSFQKKEEKLIECFNSNLRRSMILENDIPENLNIDLSMRETGTRKIKRNLNSIIEGKEEGHGIDDDNFIENDITNNIVRKEDDGLNYTIKNLSISNNTTRIPITNSNSKSYLGYDTYKRSSGLDESFLTGGEASREFMTNISPIEIIKENHYNSSFLLNMAIRWHCDPLIKYLIDGDSKFKPRIDVNVKDINGNYPLITFIRSDRFSHLNLLLYLLEKGANPNVKDGNGYSPLMLSIQKEFEMGENIQDSYVKILIEHGASVNERDANGNSLLSLAVQKNSIRMVDFFLKSGCPMNEKDASGNYPIMVAISQNQYEILVEHGANINVKDRSGTPSLIIAYDYQKMDIFKYLVEHNVTINENFTENEINSIFFRIIIDKNISSLKYIIKYGANVNCFIGSLRSTPLIKKKDIYQFLHIYMYMCFLFLNHP